MTAIFDWAWYLFRLALHPLRFALYLVHGFLIFVAKPGARYIMAGTAIALIVWQWARFAPVVEPEMRFLLDENRELLGAFYPELYPWRVHCAAILIVSGIYLLALVWGRILRPLVGAIPAPSRPLLPHLPFRAPSVRIRTVPAQVIVARLPSSKVDGELHRFVERMPDDIYDLLTREPLPAGHFRGPSEIAESRPLWPPLGLQPAPEASKESARPKDPMPPDDGAKPTRGRSAKANAAIRNGRAGVSLGEAPSARRRKNAPEARTLET